MFINENGDKKQYSWNFNDVDEDEVTDFREYSDGRIAVIDSVLTDYIEVPKTLY